MSYERITKDPQFDAVRDSHEWRYKWAARFIRNSDKVMDAACGTGYGLNVMLKEGALNPYNYTGVDRDFGEQYEGQGGVLLMRDLETWQPEFDYDVFISIETIEHIQNFRNILNMAIRAKRYAIISTPIQPNKNPFHVHNFTAEQLKGFLPDLEQYATQDSADGTVKDLYGIAAFRTML